VNVFDASALLAYLAGEDGAATVRTNLLGGGICGAANWSEVAQKVRASGGDWQLARTLLESYGLVVEPVGQADAEAAALMWQKGSGLSLADRLCLALADRLDAVAWTADRAWATSARARQIR
jgi:PIN domain nuclease of toxin-antitoxin system